MTFCLFDVKATAKGGGKKDAEPCHDATLLVQQDGAQSHVLAPDSLLRGVREEVKGLRSMGPQGPGSALDNVVT